jgi:hypothetical protein
MSYGASRAHGNGLLTGLGAPDCNDLEKVCNRPLGDMDQLA